MSNDRDTVVNLLLKSHESRVSAEFRPQHETCFTKKAITVGSSKLFNELDM